MQITIRQYDDIGFVLNTDTMTIPDATRMTGQDLCNVMDRMGIDPDEEPAGKLAVIAWHNVSNDYIVSRRCGKGHAFAILSAEDLVQCNFMVHVTWEPDPIA